MKGTCLFGTVIGRLLTDVSWTQSVCLHFSFKCCSCPGFLLGRPSTHASCWFLFVCFPRCTRALASGQAENRESPPCPSCQPFHSRWGKPACSIHFGHSTPASEHSRCQHAKPATLELSLSFLELWKLSTLVVAPLNVANPVQWVGRRA